MSSSDETTSTYKVNKTNGTVEEDTKNEDTNSSEYNIDDNSSTFESTTTKSKDQNITVYTRLRPLSSLLQKTQKPPLVPSTDKKSLLIKESNKIYEFESIFDTNCTNEELYTSSIKDVIEENVWNGYNVTIFAYGQSGSGKSYTMGTHDFRDKRSLQTKLVIGEEKKEEECILNKNDGIIPRVIYDLFEKSSQNVQIELSYLEIYNEELKDLLSDVKKELKILNDGTITNLTTLQVYSINQVNSLMKEACKKRVTALTSINNASSRSHAICIFKITHNDASAKLTLVDLAGSERVKRTNAIGDRFCEGVNINKGLLVLGQVISTLSEQAQKKSRVSNSHVPYRDSKLTRLLQDSLGGNSRTIMIACVSSHAQDVKESVNTLRYAQRARNIKNSVSVGKYNASLSNEEVMAIQRENESLKMQLQRLNRQLSNNTINSNNSPLKSSLQQHLSNNKITKKENLTLQKQNEQIQKELHEYKKRNVALQKKIRDENQRRMAETKEYKKSYAKLLRENQKLKLESSKLNNQVRNQSLVLRRKANETVSNSGWKQNSTRSMQNVGSRRVGTSYKRDAFTSRQEMINTFERDVELATLILDTKDEIDLLEKAISKEKKYKQSSSLARASSLAKASFHNTNLTNIQNEIEMRSNTIESLQKRILDLSSKNTITNNDKKDVVLLTMAQQLSYAELKYLSSYSFDTYVHTKRTMKQIIQKEVNDAMEKERDGMVREKMEMQEKYEKDILEFMELSLGIDDGTKLIVDDMLDDHFGAN